jgi:hypothetical protein
MQAKDVVLHQVGKQKKTNGKKKNKRTNVTIQAFLEGKTIWLRP